MGACFVVHTVNLLIEVFRSLIFNVIIDKSELSLPLGFLFLFIITVFHFSIFFFLSSVFVGSF